MHSFECCVVIKSSAAELEKEKPTGLVNLGNTCFMNSVVQCLISIRPIHRYVLRDEWKADLNLKHQGVAAAFAELCKGLMYTEDEFVNPAQLKRVVAKLSSGLFAGYQQNDAEELLLFFLNSLHDDLDVIKEKPKPNGREEDAWTWHLKRERSIVDRYLLGSFETSTKCAKCAHSSSTTAIFKSLQLALPTEDRVIPVVVVRQPTNEKLKKLPQRARQTRYAVMTKKTMRCESFQREIAASVRISFENLWFIWLERGGIKRELRVDSPVKLIPASSFKQPATGFVVAFEIVTDPVLLGSPEESKDAAEMDVSLRHIVCFMVEANDVEESDKLPLPPPILKLVPSLFSFSAATASIKAVTRELNENSQRYFAEQQDEFTFEYFLCDSYGVVVEEWPVMTSPGLFVDAIGVPDYKLGKQRVLFVSCVYRCKSRVELKLEFNDHASYLKLANLEGNPISTLSVRSCLSHFLQPVQLDEHNCWKCPKCSTLTLAEQTFLLTRLPEVLILVLKRFDTNGKITAMVDFPLENMDLSEFCEEISDVGKVYDLFSVINHYGSTVGGHYTSFVARDVGDDVPATIWDEVDDSRTCTLNHEEVVSSAAYILFYRRRCNVPEIL